MRVGEGLRTLPSFASPVPPVTPVTRDDQNSPDKAERVYISGLLGSIPVPSRLRARARACAHA